ncbi:hypothetical protein [Streptomyces sp. NPDC091212]|uniref:hypothetical protein n=1 Tax=Streptomyces sp. NPDC091212 TaxID=3155191 RepID=UPI003425CF62
MGQRVLTYEDIVNTPLGKLKSAADDWSEMTTKLERLTDEARDGMKARTAKADWEGVNAAVTKPFIGKTAKEFGDAAQEAKGVGLLLDDAYKAFKSAQDELTAIRDEEAPKAGIHVDPRGKATPRNPVAQDVSARTDSSYPDLLRQEAASVRSWQQRIDRIVGVCGVADDSLERALTVNVSDDHNFTAPKFRSLDQVAADRAVTMARKGRDLTHAELRELNELLGYKADSREFATAFYEGLGPKKSLEFFGLLATDVYEGTELDKQRLKDVQALQQNLGLTLAGASQDPNFTGTWAPELRKLGTQQIPLGPYETSGVPYGYQLLGGIMRYGNYNERFLNPIAEHVAQLHQKDPYRFAESKMVNGPFANRFNPSGINGAGYDPMVSMLEALGHSPEASKKFFSAEPTGYNEDGSLGEGVADLGKDGDGNPVGNYLDFLTKSDYKFFPDMETTYPGQVEKSANFLPDALGHALESATLGYAWDDPNPTPSRDATTSSIMESVVEKYGKSPTLLKQQESLSDSLGRMGAGYIDDLDWALGGAGNDSLFAPSENPDKHMALKSTQAHDFLTALGQHPDAYATLSTAQKIYSTSMLEAQFDSVGGVDEGRARAVVKTGAEFQGILDQSRADQVKAEGLKRHDDYVSAQEGKASWISYGASTAIGGGVAVAVSFIPPAAVAAGAAAVLVPLATDVASSLLQQVASDSIDDWSTGLIDKETKRIDELTGEDQKRVYSAGRDNAEMPVSKFLAHHGIGRESEFGQDLDDSLWVGYMNGNSRASQQGNGPEVQ